MILSTESMDGAVVVTDTRRVGARFKGAAMAEPEKAKARVTNDKSESIVFGASVEASAISGAVIAREEALLDCWLYKSTI